MKTDKTTLYYVTPLNRIGLHRPRTTEIFEHPRSLIMLPLSDSPEGALSVCYPYLFDDKDWNVKKFILWEIENRPRHGILTPKALKNMWGIKHAVDLELWGCFRSLRMTKVGEFKVVNSPRDIDYVDIETPEGVKAIAYRIPVNI